MPGFSFTVRCEAFDDESVAADTHERSKNSISALRDEEEKSGVRGGKTDHFVEVHDEVGKPNGGAQVVEDVPRAVRDPLAQWSPILGLWVFVPLLVAREESKSRHFGVSCVLNL